MKDINAFSTSSPKNLVEVLKFWHMVEFFVPFNLDEVCSKPETAYQVAVAQLENYGNDNLPWASPSAFAKANGDSNYECRYDLYLLPFDKSEITKISKEIFPSDQNSIKHIEFEEKFDDEGKTCFAKLTVDSEGYPNFDKISLSTLPWALGRLLERNFAAINYKNYEEYQKVLKELFRSLSCYLNNPNSEIIKDHIKPGVLTANGLVILINELKKWAGFAPNYPFAIVFETIKGKKKTPKNHLETSSNKLAVMSDECFVSDEDNFTFHEQLDIENFKNIQSFTDEEKNFAVISSETETDSQIDILNSFFIEDIEKVINDMVNNTHETIASYINGVKPEQKHDLYIKENSKFIIDKLKPQYLNHGKWLTDSTHLMSLMQQFAINECFYPSNEVSLFSVNGPPGTGKTTLLQDIVAENIVRRARILAEFSSAKDAFSKPLSINFADENITIQMLNKCLTGFEMLVASSNNAAVENISKELPLRIKLPVKYQTTCHYFSAVASKVFAEHDCNNNRVLPLDPDDMPWGLVSVALGNAKNRNRFRQRVFFSDDREKEKKHRLKTGEYLTIWEWVKQYKGISFQQAKLNFINSNKIVNDYHSNIKKFADLHQQLSLLKIDLQENERNINLLKSDLKNLINKTQPLNLSIDRIKQKKEEIFNEITRHNQLKPHWLERLFRSANAKSHKNQLNALRNDWNNSLIQERELKEEANKIHFEVMRIENNSEAIHLDTETKKREQKNLTTDYQNIIDLLAEELVLPPIDGNLEKSDVQLKAFWQNEKLNELRANLFIDALALHEAWLTEVLKKGGGFAKNLIAISKLLSNQHPVDKNQELYIWQSFFMWIPVISSTFASIARQFKHIGSKELGWLLIDEAGQAIPQAAVGAIWRAKTTLVVGDPLQIEPVFTIPPHLVEGLAQHSLKQDYEKWLPSLASVQTLADDANRLGAYIESVGQKKWIGCPLRVHRRCLDPMFSVANSIAYNNKMLNARINKMASAKYLLGASCWYHVPGKATDKQYVQAQGELLLRLFAKLYEHEQELPKIYIITPFKRIKQNLQKLLGDRANWRNYLSDPYWISADIGKLKTWCTSHIGTVHTFQGKEINTVIFILGADHDTEGAANWASSKPNLLNVALTRAQDRIFLIGDYQLWSNKNYFSMLANFLPSYCYNEKSSQNSVFS
jgi:hypothetical protein